MTSQAGLGAGRIGRQTLSVRKYLASHFRPVRGKSEGCGQKEAARGAPSRIARQILSVRKYLAIHFRLVRGKSEGCGQKEAARGAPSRIARRILSMRKYLEIHFLARSREIRGLRAN
jgi:hypothetical protein